MADPKILGPFFSNPLKSGTPDSTLHAVYDDLFSGITSRSRVRILMNMWSEDNRTGRPSCRKIMQTLIDRFQTSNDVDLVLLLDNDDYTEADISGGIVKLLRDGLGEGRVQLPLHKAPGAAFETEEGSRPSTTKLHQKTALFSRLQIPHNARTMSLRGRTLEHVVVVSSANIWPTQYRQVNETVVFHDNAGLYNWMRARVSRIEQEFTGQFGFLPTNPDFLNPGGDFAFPRADGDEDDEVFGRVKAYALPRDQSPNLPTRILDNVLEAFDPQDPPTLRVGMAFFSLKGVAGKLKTLVSRGADVGVILRNPLNDGPEPGSSRLDVVEILQDGHVPLTLVPDPVPSGRSNQKVHSKFLTVHGPYPFGRDVAVRKLTFFGSFNWTGVGHDKNSESLFRINDPTVHDEFRRHWEEVRAAARAS